MEDVIEGELVSPSDDLPEQSDLEQIHVLTKRQKEAILSRLGPVSEDDDTFDPGQTLTVCAQWAGIAPEVLEQCIYEGLANPESPNRRFALDANKRIADRESALARKGFQLAIKKRDAAFFRTTLERQHRDWKPPDKGPRVQNNLTIVGKLSLAQSLRQNKTLPTGD